MIVEFNRQLLGVEDLLFGVGTVTQDRGGQSVVVTKINAANLPFDESQTLQEVLDTNYSAIFTVSQNINAVNTNADNVNSINANADNINAIVGVDNNETNINTCSTNIAAIIDAPNQAAAAANSAAVAAAYANIDWAGFNINDGDLIVTYVDGATSVPSLVDGEFIITY